MTWDPRQYLQYETLRLRPALELLNRIPEGNPQRIIDLGCGPGNVTRLLKMRWPEAQVTGIDHSAEMLQVAAQYADIQWVLENIAHWQPEPPVDILFSNAALHWVQPHEELFPRLMSGINPGGVFAVQMPANFDAPSHTAMAAAAKEGPWSDTLAPLLEGAGVLPMAEYYDILSPLAYQIDLWETTYIQVMDGEDPVVEWTRGSALRPLLAALSFEAGEAFESLYREKLRRAYPQQPDGKTLFPFRRLFIVARKKP